MKLLLCDINEELVYEWGIAFAGLPNVEIVHGRFEDQQFDCMVSAANSFGLMDGGVDGAITRYFGTQLMERVQRAVLQRYAGEQPVGTSMIVSTENTEKPWLAHTPTMRVPLDIRGTDNVYDAMRAMLLEVKRHNARYILEGGSPIHTVCCPGLGTMAGRVPPDVAARQMAQAYRSIVNRPVAISWQHAMETQRRVVSTGAYDTSTHNLAVKVLTPHPDLAQHVADEIKKNL